MTQLLVAHMKLKLIHKLVQKFDPCVNSLDYIRKVLSSNRPGYGLFFLRFLVVSSTLRKSTGIVLSLNTGASFQIHPTYHSPVILLNVP